MFYHRKSRILILNFITFHDLHSVWKSIFCLFACIKLFFSWTIFLSFCACMLQTSTIFHSRNGSTSAVKLLIQSHKQIHQLCVVFMFFRKQIASFCTSKNGQVLRVTCRMELLSDQNHSSFFYNEGKIQSPLKLAAAAVNDTGVLCSTTSS